LGDATQWRLIGDCKSISAGPLSAPSLPIANVAIWAVVNRICDYIDDLLCFALPFQFARWLTQAIMLLP
jgi:hypothetical protein